MAIEDPCGFPAVDKLIQLDVPTLNDYVRAASEYIQEPELGSKKGAQIRLSRGLARILKYELASLLPHSEIETGEPQIGGGLRNVQADVADTSPLEGVRLAVEIKPVNLAVGRAFWNRFGDIRTFATNVHLKFPYAVVGGILTVPTYELTSTGEKKPTAGLIGRGVDRLARASTRETEGDAPHMLEATAVVVYDPDARELSPDVPPSGLGLRWREFVPKLVEAYQARWGTGEL